jgi:hypothetical protein
MGITECLSVPAALGLSAAKLLRVFITVMEANAQYA